jgi:hypothetical protein
LSLLYLPAFAASGNDEVAEAQTSTSLLDIPRRLLADTMPAKYGAYGSSSGGAYSKKGGSGGSSNGGNGGDDENDEARLLHQFLLHCKDSLPGWSSHIVAILDPG